MNRFKNTPDPTQGDKPLILQPNEVFVFGANKLGIHAGGSAAAAVKFYGAIEGEIHRTGRSYGLVTVNKPGNDRITIPELEQEFGKFILQTQLEPEKTFYLTKVGIGIAGWRLPEVIMAFKLSYIPDIHKNIVLPIEFK
jgi:hypothetical protein